jgi:hypothetical protein
LGAKNQENLSIEREITGSPGWSSGAVKDLGLKEAEQKENPGPGGGRSGAGGEEQLGPGTLWNLVNYSLVSQIFKAASQLSVALTGEAERTGVWRPLVVPAPEYERYAEHHLQAQHDQRVPRSDEFVAHKAFLEAKRLWCLNCDFLAGESWVPGCDSAHGPPLVEYVHRQIVLDSDHHGFEDVHIPAFGDAKAENFIGFRHEPAT